MQGPGSRTRIGATEGALARTLTVWIGEGGADCGGLKGHNQDVGLECENSEGAPEVAGSRGMWPDAPVSAAGVASGTDGSREA